MSSNQKQPFAKTLQEGIQEFFRNRTNIFETKNDFLVSNRKIDEVVKFVTEINYYVSFAWLNIIHLHIYLINLLPWHYLVLRVPWSR